jgi:hypothetical protein
VKCKHIQPRRYVRYLGEFNQPLATMAEVTGSCLSCDAWLPLGPSDETEPRVALEIRATLLAERMSGVRNGTVLTRLEYCGWMNEETFVAHGEVRPLDTNSVEWLAGHLARCIVEHGDGS